MSWAAALRLPSPDPARAQPRGDPRLAAGAGSRPDGGGWEPGRRPAELSKPGASESAGCPVPGSLPLAVFPRRAPVSSLTHTRPPAAARLGVAAIPPSPTAFPSPGPPLTSAAPQPAPSPAAQPSRLAVPGPYANQPIPAPGRAQDDQ